MSRSGVSVGIDRRALIRAGAAIGALQFAAPFIIQARGETPIKIGMVDPLTGAYAAVARSEVEGAKLAVQEINGNGGITGRPIELLVEDSANDTGNGGQKTRKLIERDGGSFIIRDGNPRGPPAIAQVTNEKNILHILPSGQSDAITRP